MLQLARNGPVASLLKQYQSTSELVVGSVGATRQRLKDFLARTILFSLATLNASCTDRVECSDSSWRAPTTCLNCEVCK